jgi:YgiT-type zinc finger domain-containing protein
MKSNIENCSGECQTREITHTVRYHGQVVVIDHVPAEVCSVCGDVLLSPETVRHIEQLLSTAHRPAREVPLYEYA